ncbi:MAG: FtsX-like permease family protein [Bacteroidetes bacterium]|nr:MAG: FtsX-like permease family protein [Bacteroidota bacterium]
MLFITLFKESFLFAVQALVTNKLRSFLSLLGITIGIFSIISVFTMTDSLEKKLRDSVKSLGDDVIYIQKWPWTFGPDYPWWKYMNRPVPNISELREVEKWCKKGDAFAFMISANGTAKYKSNSVENANMICVSHQYDKIRSFVISEGRYFTENESESGKSICIIGNTIAEGLFGQLSAVGKEIKVRGSKLTVVGVLKKEGESMLGNNVDTQILIPINFARNLVDLRNDRFEPMIMVKARAGVSNDELIDELTGIMRGIRKLKPIADDSFALNQTSMISSQVNEIFDVVGIAGWAIGGFSILVGGFGIANIMFVSVKERTNLIGIQKSLGAKNYFVLLQFLAEAVMLSVMGGIIGLVLIYAGTFVVESAMEMEVPLTRSNVILGMTISALIGVVSGFVPAYTASQLDPVEAIRTN